MSVIEIRDLHVSTIVGVLPEERVRYQPLAFDIDIERDFTDAARTDDLALTTNYAEIIKKVEEVSHDGRFLLLETLAHRVGEAVLAFDGFIASTTVAVRKLKPPVDADVTSVGVRVTLRR